ncbi:MAG: restriction endonuclease [Ruminococcaceae bacterium]|nr:restriction endonuclease [Oscillospiraceae bacterium]
MTYKEAIVKSLEALGGHAYYQDIYQKFSEIYDGELTKTWKKSIQSVIERHSSNSSVFTGKDDLFEAIEGIGKGHWGLKNYSFDEQIELTQEDDEFVEGKISLKRHLQRERNVKLIRTVKNKFIADHGHLYCEVCGFDFEKIYGELGKDFIEAHHLKPISQMTDNEKTKVEDILMVCSNCHSMIHRKKPWLTKGQIKTILK